MKKILLIAMALCLVMSGTAFALIASSPHDFSDNIGFDADDWNNSNDQICQPCHTPHNAAALEGTPLWNHQVSAVGTYALYTGVALNATDITNPAGVSKICLACHDGTVGLENYGSTTSGAGTPLTGTANVGIDLSNDHPISFTYNPGDASTQDNELNSLDSAKAAGAQFYGGSATEVECASCHDVHNTAEIAKLLVISNASSALCLACHLK